MDLKLGGEVRPVDLVVFDCDGVLLDSMEQKIRAFREWVPAAHAGYAAAFMERVMHGFGRSRRYHIEGFYTELVGTPLDVEALEAEIARFTDICEPLCAEAGWLPGSREFVEACVDAGTCRYVLSGTPQEPLVAMLAAHGAREVSAEEPDALFHRILGSPPAKPEQMEAILAETGIPAERAVFIGDAEADRAAAAHVGAHFVYKPSAAARPTGELVTIAEDLREVLF
jgi:phosphoglycolate phosphatase-like HAD superfamily hydrolase